MEEVCSYLNGNGYIDIQYLGEGAFGVVLSAKAIKLLRKVAIKIVAITPALSGDISNLKDEITVLK